LSAGQSGSGRIEDPRVYLAAERTFLAWIRTSVSLMGFGFLIARFAFFLREYGLTNGLSASASARTVVSSWLGFGMVCVGVAVCVMAATRHRAYIQALEKGVGNPSLDVRTSLLVAAILAMVGLAIAIHIVML
jgi:putative membrane protein